MIKATETTGTTTATAIVPPAERPESLLVELAVPNAPDPLVVADESFAEVWVGPAVEVNTTVVTCPVLPLVGDSVLISVVTIVDSGVDVVSGVVVVGISELVVDELDVVGVGVDDSVVGGGVDDDSEGVVGVGVSLGVSLGVLLGDSVGDSEDGSVGVSDGVFEAVSVGC